jgi:hypothetical protein
MRIPQIFHVSSPHVPAPFRIDFSRSPKRWRADCRMIHLEAAHDETHEIKAEFRFWKYNCSNCS